MLMHTLLWVALAIWSYMTAGPYTAASCWSIVMLYFPPLGFLWLVVGFSSLAFLIASITRPHLRTSAWFWGACHGLVLAIGLQASPLAAYAAAGQVACL
ncbi:MAG: hypothetical protein ACK4PN_06710 [Allorhizobium sp.]